jgi:two-component system, chemotaxis family, response regulator Rcp1
MKALTEVLLVDDNSADTELTAELLMRSDRPIHLQSVSDGVEAMALLRCEGKYSDALKPQFIMLDLNMPGKNGWEVLADVKSDSTLKTITVVIFTTSQATNDIAQCLELGANSYVSKPNNLEEFASTITAIGNYWFDVASMMRQEEL